MAVAPCCARPQVRSAPPAASAGPLVAWLAHLARRLVPRRDPFAGMTERELRDIGLRRNAAGMLRPLGDLERRW